MTAIVHNMLLHSLIGWFGKRFVRYHEISAGFARGRHVGRAGIRQNMLRAFDPFRIVTMDREQYPASFDAALKTLGSTFGLAHSNQTAQNRTHRPTHPETCEQTHNGSSGNEGTDPWNSEQPDSSHPAKRPADYRSGACSCDRSFWRFGILLVRKIFGPHILGHQYGYVGFSKASLL